MSSTSIYDGSSRFQNNLDVVHVRVEGDVCVIAEDSFSGCEELISFDFGCSSRVTTIGNSAFCRCYKLTGFSLSPTVTVIQAYAFARCTSLTSFTIPPGVTSIAESTFYDCNLLASISLPLTVTSIRDKAMCGCTSLVHVALPPSLTSIGAYAFDCCSALTRINIPSGVTVIEECAFKQCAALVRVSLGSAVTRISRRAFALCTSLVSLPLSPSVVDVHCDAFSHCTFLLQKAASHNVSVVDFLRDRWSAIACRVTVLLSLNHIACLVIASGGDASPEGRDFLHGLVTEERKRGRPSEGEGLVVQDGAKKRTVSGNVLFGSLAYAKITAKELWREILVFL